MPRKIFLATLALLTASLAGYVLIEAIITDHLTQQVIYALLPLVLLCTLAVNALRKPRD
ncbi:hypothetical protein [Maritimibacter sp. DP1N21-5]|uniref:hypothetical protein n=1 Tax=Maritimibacter sp. DP1N21-5 TaxID=2836867 RepID=UPI001C48648E|nr:hypothetical protein [Maritimibacter sp. DP1N21-5]MBV7409650.1 hypothetical protein [Maritimibacter sp. DP1N21-5]